MRNCEHKVVYGWDISVPAYSLVKEKKVELACCMNCNALVPVHDYTVLEEYMLFVTQEVNGNKKRTAHQVYRLEDRVVRESDRLRKAEGE